MGLHDDLFETARSKISRSWIEDNFHAPGAEWKRSSKGHLEYHTLNPTRGDREIGSFSISETGLYSDFADPSFHGDAIQLYSIKRGLSLIDAAKEIAGVETPNIHVVRPEPPAIDYPTSLVDTKGEVPSVPGALVTEYRDHETGFSAFFVIRIDREGQKKIIYPMSWNGKSFEKKIWPWYKKRPLMKPKFRDGWVLLVEGEKKCVLAQQYFDKLQLKCSVITWHGGAGAVGMIDVPDGLDKRNILAWPDNDAVGIEAMVKIRERFFAGMVIMQPPSGVPDHWDVADALAKGMDVAKLLAEVIGGEHRLKEAPKLPEAIENGSPSDAEPTTGDNLPLTDLGNAERLVRKHGDKIRYNYDRNCWAVFHDGMWDSDNYAAMTPLVKDILNDLSEVDWKFANKTESLRGINNMMTLASREPGIPVKEADFDKEKNLFMCANGLLDLTTGQIIESKPEMLISKKSAVAYNKDAECPNFKAFLDDITQGNGPIMEFFRRWFGLCLSGDMSPQSFAIFYGAGANGKSTLVELISKIMGPYSKTAPSDTFTSRPGGQGIPNDIAGLRGSRMVLTTETESNAKLAESRIKQLTGEDKVSARFMRGEFFEFNPSWKIIISTNHRPRISGNDHGIWRRVILVPFDFTCSADKMDPLLPSKLWEEREGILSWMVGGAKDYFSDGGGRAALKVPEIMNAAVEEYRVDEDVLGRFISEECYGKEEIAKMMYPDRVSSGVLHKIFQAWAEENNEIAAGRMSSIQFGKAMKERGFESTRMGAGGARTYVGICPKNIVQGERE